MPMIQATYHDAVLLLLCPAQGESIGVERVVAPLVEAAVALPGLAVVPWQRLARPDPNRLLTVPDLPNVSILECL